MPSRAEVVEVRDAVREMRAGGASFDEIAEIMQFESGPAEAVAYELDLIQYDDSTDIDVAIDNLVSLNPKPLQDYMGGKTSAMGSLVGLIKKSNPALDAKRIRARLEEKLKTE